MSSIYDHPGIYDLEHSGPQGDVSFFVELIKSHRPAKILEYACGNGRLTLPVAEAAAAWGGAVSGVDASAPMLDAARQADSKGLVQWHEANLMTWKPSSPCDLLFSGCASLSHLLTLDQQLAAWRNAHASLAPEGRFIVAEVMPDYPTLADAMRSPSRAALFLDGDFDDGAQHLLRCRATRYRADFQRMHVRYFYDCFSADAADRFVDDYHAHVYFPNELRLLFVASGFTIEAEWGDYERGSLRHDSRVIVVCGRKPPSG